MFIVEIFICFFLAVIAEESDSVPGTRLAISENCSRCTFFRHIIIDPCQEEQGDNDQRETTTKTFKERVNFKIFGMELALCSPSGGGP